MTNQLIENVLVEFSPNKKNNISKNTNISHSFEEFLSNKNSEKINFDNTESGTGNKIDDVIKSIKKLVDKRLKSDQSHIGDISPEKFESIKSKISSYRNNINKLKDISEKISDTKDPLSSFLFSNEFVELGNINSDNATGSNIDNALTSEINNINNFDLNDVNKTGNDELKYIPIRKDSELASYLKSNFGFTNNELSNMQIIKDNNIAQSNRKSQKSEVNSKLSGNINTTQMADSSILKDLEKSGIYGNDKSNTILNALKESDKPIKTETDQKLTSILKELEKSGIKDEKLINKVETLFNKPLKEAVKSGMESLTKPSQELSLLEVNQKSQSSKESDKPIKTETDQKLTSILKELEKSGITDEKLLNKIETLFNKPLKEAVKSDVSSLSSDKKAATGLDEKTQTIISKDADIFLKAEKNRKTTTIQDELDKTGINENDKSNKILNALKKADSNNSHTQIIYKVESTGSINIETEKKIEFLEKYSDIKVKIVKNKEIEPTTEKAFNTQFSGEFSREEVAKEYNREIKNARQVNNDTLNKINATQDNQNGKNQNFDDNQSNFQKNFSTNEVLNPAKNNQETQSKELPKTLNFNNVRPQEVPAKITKMIQTGQENGTVNAKLNLYPKALGRVFVELDIRNNNVKINFKAESRETVKILENQISSLKDGLKQQGINTDLVNIKLNDEDSYRGDLSNRNSRDESSSSKERRAYSDSFTKDRREQQQEEKSGQRAAKKVIYKQGSYIEQYI